MIFLKWLGLIWIAWVLLTGPVQAHTLSESISNWQILSNGVRLQFLVPDLEAKRLSPSGLEMPTADTLGLYLKSHVGVTTKGLPCALLKQPQAMNSTPGFSRFEFEFGCSSIDGLKIRSTAFYEIVPSHTNFARVETLNGDFFEALLTGERREIEVAQAAGVSPLQAAGLSTFVGMGIMHIFTGIDHMSFMLGLVLISRRVRDLLFVVTGFTIGHSLTLALAVTGVLRPDAQYIDSLVALTIALIGAENIGDSTHRPLPVALGLGGIVLMLALLKGIGLDVRLPMTLLVGGGIFSVFYLLLTGQMRDAGRVRLGVTLIFGLIHGFGFASNLLEMRLPPDHLARLLLGFNLGVEIGQVTVVLGALGLAQLIVRLHMAIPRPLFSDLAASFLVGEGLFWFVGRTLVAG